MVLVNFLGTFFRIIDRKKKKILKKYYNTFVGTFKSGMIKWE